MRTWISSFGVALLVAVSVAPGEAWAQASGAERAQILEKANALKAQVGPFELDTYGRLKNDYNTMDTLKRALELEEKAYGPKDPRLAETLERLADAYALANREHLAKPAYQRLLTLKRKTLRGKRARLKPYIQLAKTPLIKRTLALASLAAALEKEAWGGIAAARKLDVLRKVFKQIKQTHSLLEKAYGKNDARVERAKTKAANRYVAKARSILVGVGPLELDDSGKLVGSREVLEGLKAALALEEQAYGKDDPRVADTLRRLGDTCAVAGDRWALKIYQRLLVLKTQEFGEGDARLAPYAGRVDDPMAKRKVLLLAKAASLKKQAEEIDVRSVGPDGYWKAFRILSKALRLEEEAYGKDSIHLVDMLDRIADNRMLAERRGFVGKKRLLDRILTIQESALEPDSPLLKRTQSLVRAVDLEIQADTFAGSKNLGAKRQGLALLKEVLALREKVYGSNDPRIAYLVERIAKEHGSLDDDRNKARWFGRFLSIQEGVFGSDSVHVLGHITLLAHHFLMLDFSRAEPLHDRSLRILKKAYERRDPLAYADVLVFQGVYVYLKQRRYGKAETLLLQAKQLHEQSALPGDARIGRFSQGKYSAPGKYSKTKNDSMVKVLDGLQLLYWQRGQRARATAIRKTILTHLETVHGARSEVLARQLTFYANTERRRDNGSLGEAWERRALGIFQYHLGEKEKALGKDDLALRMAIENVGQSHRNLGDVEKAQTFFERAYHLDEARSATTLANFFFYSGQYARAIPLLEGIYKDVTEQAGVAMPGQGSLLAKAYAETGRYDPAETLFRGGLAAAQAQYGKGHRWTTEYLGYLAWLYLRKGEPDKAIPLYVESQEIWENYTRQMMMVGSEQDKRTVMEKIDYLLGMMVSVHLQYAPNNPAAVDLATTTLLRRKGRVLDAVSNTMTALRRRMSPKDQALLDELKDTRARLAKRMMAGAKALGPDEFARQVAALEEKTRVLETAISKSNKAFRKQAQKVTLNGVQKAIPPGAKLVELVRANKLKEKFGLGFGLFFEGAHYAAYVLGPTGRVQWANLGDAATIDQAVNELRAALSNPSRTDVKALARRVHDRVMKPLASYLGDTTHVFIAPDGDLNLVPFGALVDERDRFLIERYSFTYLTSGRDLLRFGVREEAQSQGAIFANPRYDRGSRSAADQTVAGHRGQRSHALGETRWSPLPGTATEASLLAKKLPRFKVYTDAEATESAIKSIQGPRVLHVATHGFFLPNLGAENPLLSTGLVFAGADQLSSGKDDGVLTGLEAAGLDLAGTELVVLSACETGLGEVSAGEGVYGLKRALVLAGARTQVLSLWKVADNATQALMTNYYGALDGGDRIEAMRQVQLDMLMGRLTSSGEQSGDRGAVRLGADTDAPAFTDWQHPYYWAAFTVSGAGGPIELNPP